MEIFALIGLVIAIYFSYLLYTKNPQAFSSENVEKSMLIFGVLGLFLIVVIGLAVLSIRGV
tara:strand:+ start:929 stop:1111 length:183 start_codon:yes stop_codon:yes gene_type:complete